jgi:hypothetical protein
MKIGNKLKETQVYLTGNLALIPLDSRTSPDLLRGTGKSIGGDLDVDDEGSEQRRFEPVQSLYHGSVGYQPCTHELASPRRLCPCKRIENTNKNRKEQSRIADE